MNSEKPYIKNDTSSLCAGFIATEIINDLNLELLSTYFSQFLYKLQLR
jgi:hypothetical protein